MATKVCEVTIDYSVVEYLPRVTNSLEVTNPLVIVLNVGVLFAQEVL
jgi:hypothetical protein